MAARKKQPTPTCTQPHGDLRSLDWQLMLIAAFRYCLGRQSYIVGACLDWLPTIWERCSQQTQDIILRDTAEALMDGRAGSAFCEVPGWKKFLAWGMEHVTEEQQRWVRRAVAHTQKPWPGQQ